ncbi:MAG: hypothetical protein AVDCRST_MAG77-5861 [uncultured Chloroflexi bacterium]|uniref:histidine kinase n=1 Tax=uncultured Chloroflexota bacterium TaxID=166587 RepID=A0A6J4KEB8_9CHLR|nr:MAG: hypothetical protein AVDCRST_MAG77-5861 [uncultured Chloroflexota bacterium]
MSIESHTPAALDLLLVEDNPADVRLMHETLTDAVSGQVRVRHAASLTEALCLLGDACPDVVLLDLMLGDSAGMATLDRVVAAAPGVPVVVLTGLAEREVAEEAQRRGAQDYIGKGDLTPALLSRVLRYAVARAHATRAALERQRLEGALLVARTVAHEINNALAPVVGYTDLLSIRPAVAGDAMAMAYVRRIADAGTDISAKVQRLQCIIRLEVTPSALGPDQPLLDVERSGDAGASAGR